MTIVKRGIMATNVKQKILCLKKFFDCKCPLPEGTTGTEKIDETTEKKNDTVARLRDAADIVDCDRENGVAARVDSDDEKNIAGKVDSDKENDVAAKVYCDENAKKEESSGTRESTKKNDKRRDSEDCKNFITENDVGQVKLAEIINNSIKEAVLSIVKVGVCPVADSPVPRVRDTPKVPVSCVPRGAQVRENKPDKRNKPDRSNRPVGSNKSCKANKPDKENKPNFTRNPSSFKSSAIRTFDSHFGHSQCQESSKYEPSLSPQIRRRTSKRERINVNQGNRELCSYINKVRKPKSTRSTKSTKQKEKKTRDIIPKMSRPAKGSSRVRTDNRRMTGNVNIYICSEANGNTKEAEKKQKDADRDIEESETASETKTCDSNLSVSTSKLVAALRKKKPKIFDDQPLSCLCETPEISQKLDSIDSIDNTVDRVLCHDDEQRESDFPDTRTLSSIDDCTCEDTNYNDLNFPGFEIERDSDLDSIDKYTSYDKNNFWSRSSDDFPNYGNNCTRFKAKEPCKIGGRNFNERCTCCDAKRCQNNRNERCACCDVKRCPNNRKVSLEKSCYRETGETRNACPRIIEMGETSCCADKKLRASANRPVDKESTPANKTQNYELGKSPSHSDSSLLKFQKAAPTKSETKPVRNSRIVPANAVTETVDKNDLKIKDAAKLDEPIYPGIISRQTSDESEPKALEEETTRQNDNVENDDTEQDPKTGSKDENDSQPVIPDKKRRSSFFHRSIDIALSMLRARKSEVNKDPEDPNLVPRLEQKSHSNSPTVNEDEKDPSVQSGWIIRPSGQSGSEVRPSGQSGSIVRLFGQSLSEVRPSGQPSSEVRPSGQPSSEVRSTGQSGSEARPPGHSGSEVRPSEQSGSEVVKDKAVARGESTVNPEKRSMTRISNAIASRKSSAASTNKIFSPDVSPEQAPTESTKIPETEEPCECKKVRGSCDCYRKVSVPVRDESFTIENCKFAKNSSVINEEEMEISRFESRACPRCQNPADPCNCCARKNEPAEVKTCKCWPGETYRVPEKSQPLSCRRPTEVTENCCKRRCCDCSEQETKPVLCSYCQNPEENCICNAPIRKCSQCCFPLDVCNCKPAPCCGCSGRQIVPAEGNKDQTMSVTAWKPRRNVRRFFARSVNEADGISDEDCSCWEHPKPYGSDELPYQKQDVFSDVMSELQQKMSDSVCCDVCRMVPCCCCSADEESNEKAETRPCLSTIEEHRSRGRSQKRSQSKSPIESCNCGATAHRGNSCRQSASVRICERCCASPCRCRRDSKSPKKKPQAKCYYCKSLPCICAPAFETANSRPFRNADSSRRRRKERRCTIEENKSIKIGNENGYRGRDNIRLVPCPEIQQPIRKYCYRGNNNGSNPRPLLPGERVR